MWSALVPRSGGQFCGTTVQALIGSLAKSCKTAHGVVHSYPSLYAVPYVRSELTVGLATRLPIVRPCTFRRLRWCSTLRWRR